MHKIPKVSFVIPALNEEESIDFVIRDIPKDFVREIVVVDNGSYDRTAQVAVDRGAKVVAEPIRGYGSACWRGMSALDHNTEIVVFIDADYSDYPQDLHILLETLLSNKADLVIGSRLLGRREKGALLPQAIIGNKLAVFLIRLFYGFQYTDLGPFRAIRYDALMGLGMRDRGFGWTVEMQIRAIQKGLRVVEVPVRYRKRIGTSKITGTVSGSIKAGVKIIFTIIKYSFLR
ncbi:MAG: glycosyltransferase [Candidatus Scalindua sp. AMX11]|nr:MAG: glycosyltransferase [Candidatus Scalindua sp.]NOG84360.1 glycosyltransferase [Planctomycetota bacterium]RZV74441.1 MAG: glycosyltransferase [Candidatus Scalindua sp. SCAELEC01]TDE65362.1 MAG: glycosyltransferase [Candidatus Scalindua sp. AMX11]GJQ60312.1 MAG: glycosyl hydrolase [Candidatus Scalindua sp.]